MGALRKSLWTIVAILALPAPAAAQDVCAALQRIITSAGEATPFESLRSALAGGDALVPGFAPEDCRVTVEGLFCSHHVDARDVTFDGWPNPLGCAGLVPIEWAEHRRRTSDLPHGYHVGSVWIEYASWCRSCAGPRTSYFVANLMTRRRAGA